MPTYNYSKLSGRITEIYGSQRAFANALGKSDSYVSRFLNHKFYLEQPELEEWMNLLLLPLETIKDYFFTLRVDETQTDESCGSNEQEEA